MKRIEILERAKENGISYSDIDVNPTFGAAYFNSKEAGNKVIHFQGLIMDYDIDEILRDCKRFGIESFTISSTNPELSDLMAEFIEKGCSFEGLWGVKSLWKDGPEGEIKSEIIPAFKLSIH